MLAPPYCLSMTATRAVELEGHIIDSGIIETVFDIIMDMGGAFEVETFDIGRSETERSYALLTVKADDSAHLQSIMHELHQNGANPVDPNDAQLQSAPDDQVVPPEFYSTTNHPTDIRYEGEWLTVENPEMDCAVVVEPDGPEGPRAYTEVLNAIEAGDLVVAGNTGIRVRPPERPRGQEGAFGFMQGGISSERPSASTIAKIADAVAETTRDDGNVLVVAGPALIHSGAREGLARLVRAGYVDMLSVGNGFAVHDVERDLYGTSLGMDTETLDHPRKGHKHHIYTISEVIRAGGLEPAVADGTIESGVIYECIEHDADYVIAGSIRDDGPLPDTITDAVEAQSAIREQARRADLVVMLSTLLHSVAVGNCLPSTTRTICVDIDPATVTQLVDRGSAQAVGMVTDVGTFVPMLVDELLDE